MKTHTIIKIVFSLLLLFIGAHLNAAVTYIHTDALGSVIAESDASGTVTKRHRYAPYGESLETAQNNAPGYTGHVYDDDLGLSYMKARYYDPLIGRFYSNDPSGFSPHNLFSFNRYAYANNNPYKFVDPDGQVAETIFDVVSLGLSYNDFRNEPSIVNGLALAYDTFATAIPFVPAGAGMIKQASKSNAISTLYRAVGPDELNDIQKTGKFINRGSAEGKYFTSSREHASDYAKQAVKAFGDEPYTIVKTDISTSSLPTPVSVDGGIPAFVLPDKVLPDLKPDVLNSMEIGRMK